MNSDLVKTSSLVILTTIAVMTVLWVLQSILMPFVIAVMLSYLLSPAIEKLATLKIPRLVSLFVIFLLGFLLLGNFLRTIAGHLIQVSAAFPSYREQFHQLINQYSDNYPFVNDALDNVSSFLFSLPYGTIVNTALGSTVTYLSNLFLILLFVTYLCLSSHSLPSKIVKAFPGARGKYLLQIQTHINKDIRKYVSIHTLISLATGFSVGLVCWFFGVPFALLWGFLAFLLNYIPTIGSILSSVPPIITAAVVLGIQPALWLALLLIGLQMVWGNIVEPKIAGTSLGISPLIILLSLVFWGWLWGIVGAILAVPIAVMIKVTCANIPVLKPISVLMGE